MNPQIRQFLKDVAEDGNKFSERAKELLNEKEKYHELFVKIKYETGLPDKWDDIIIEWLKYKSEKGQSYKPTGLKKFIATLLKLSYGSTEIAQQIIDKSITNNYAGIFEIKDAKTQQYTFDNDRFKVANQ